jgi:putative NIF3 family GTP cyclohydrolase 1 type 2
LQDAIRNSADIFITGDFKYHEFFDAEDKIVIADIGHFESEQFTTNIIAEKLKEKFTNFAIRLTEINTNPINYF